MTETIQQAAERLTRGIGNRVKAYEYATRMVRLRSAIYAIMQADGRRTFRMMSEIDGVLALNRLEKPEQGWPMYGLASLGRRGRLAAVTSGSANTDADTNCHL